MAQGSMKLAAAAAMFLLALLPATASAVQPIDPLGPQLRLTQQGVDGTQDVDAFGSDLAYNSQRNEFLLVWTNQTALPALDREIFARRLAADGTPLAPAFQVSGLPGSVVGVDASDPAVAYDAERDRYGVTFVRADAAADIEAWLQMVSGDGQIVGFDGTPGPDARVMSSVGTGSVREPDVLYRPDADNAGLPGDRWIVTYAADVTTVGETDILLSTRDANGAGGETNNAVSNFAAVSAFARDPSIAAVPGGDDVVVAFEGTTNGTDFEIYTHREPGSLSGSGQTQITNTPGPAQSAFDPEIAADPVNSQLLVAFQADKLADGDFEIGVQRLDFGLGPLGADDQVVSSAGPAGSGTAFTVQSPAVAYSPALQRYVISWIGTDTDRAGLSNDEHEVQATSLDANGTEGAPEDFLVSRMGADNDEDARPRDTALALNAQSGRWLSLWTSDEARPPLADEELEIFGRQIGENFDHDGDGSVFPTDCDDNNASIRPGATDVFENGVDEDCSGADAINLDRDGDGSPRPADCDDANPKIRPGIPDVPNNSIDEDCDGKKRRTMVDVKVERFFAVFSDFTHVTRLRVSKLRRGMRIQVRCTGKGCPKALRKGKVRKVKVKKSGRKDFTKLFKRAELKPGAVVELRVLQTGAIGRVDRFVIRDGKVPKRVLRCMPPGAKKPRACS